MSHCPRLAGAILGAATLFGAHLANAQTFTRRIATGLSRPVASVSPPGDLNRLFIAEQHSGIIKLLDLGTGTVSATPVLELDGLSTGNEQGLLGLAFDPDFASNGYFYVNVTTSADGGATHIRRYQVSGPPATATTALLSSEREILSFAQPQSNHNGGWIDFSPNDGYLYIASGDGGSGNDTGTGHTPGIGNAQDVTNNLLGKILRIDVNGDDFPSDAGKNYAVPANNPFVDAEGDDEIWSYGLRNPYRSSFDRETGDLWIGDVGQDVREEINFQAASSTGGENYGWRLREGTVETHFVGGPPPLGNVEPIYDYDHNASDANFRGNVVIGGYVYRGPIPAFRGHYFFSDAGSANIWKLDPDAVNPRASVTRVNSKLTANAGVVNGLSSFGEDGAGNLYLMELSGELFRVETNSLRATWNGNRSDSGIAGDGATWGSAANWTRGASTDQAFVAEDEVVFAAGSTVANIQLQSDRIVSAVAFQAPYTLQNATLRVLSGNLDVSEGVTAAIESTLAAETANHSLRKLGPGTLLVNGVAGQMVVKAGTLGGTGTIDFLRAKGGATIAPGTSVGELSVANSFTMEPEAVLALEIGPTGVVDRLSVGGTAHLDGTLNVQLISENDASYVPQVGDGFTFLTAEVGLSGAFDGLNLPLLGAGLQWALVTGATTLRLEVNSTLEGDFDNNGVVDANDLAVWSDNFGLASGASRASGDADGDSDVDGRDFLVWQQRLGSTVGGGLAQAVPEPVTLVLGLFAACGILLNRDPTILACGP